VPVVGAGWARFDGAKVPVDLLGAIREAAAHRPNGAPLYNELNDGGFLIYHAPSLRVFNDDRCELHRGPWHLRTTVESRSRPAVIEEWRRRYGFDLALVRTDGPDAALFDYLSGAAGWHLLARGRCAALFEYTGP
jgi:hypothetical protein